MTPQKTAMNAEQKAREIVDKLSLDVGVICGHTIAEQVLPLFTNKVAAALTESYREGQESIMARLPSEDEITKENYNWAKSISEMFNKVKDDDELKSLGRVPFAHAAKWVIERVRGEK